MSPSTVDSRVSPSRVTPPLQNGDRLTAEEFERRYDAAGELTKAELLDGVVYMPPPVSDSHHGAPHFDMVAWLGAYRWGTPGVVGGDNSTLRLDLRNRPQPDAYLRILPQCGGQARLDADGYVISAPELVTEVAASSVSYDLNDKLDVYRRHRVREYVVWRVFDETVDWFVLRDERYEPAMIAADAVYRSAVLPGLWLDPVALVRGDVARLAQLSRDGLASLEHAAFVAELQRRASAG